MFAVLGEDDSDANSLVVLVRRISGLPNQTILKKGFRGCGHLRQNACRVIREFHLRGATRFIICHDADNENPEHLKKSVRSTLLKSGCREFVCEIVVPVQELEAWIIADNTAIKKLLNSLSIPNVTSPEHINDPKGWLRRRSRISSKANYTYVPTIHNERIALHIDLDTLERKCPSFRPLKDFVQAGKRGHR
jgi:hypothetical protein